MTKLLKMLFAAAILFFAAINFCPAQTPPYFNVLNYGATGNGTTLDSPAINNAIAAAGAAGGGIIGFPAGNYLCGSIHLTNNITLDLSNNAVILASLTNIDAPEFNVNSNYQDFGHSHFHDALIWGENLTNLTFAGPGKIDGNGKLTQGDSVSTGQGDKAFALVQCTNVVFASITITHAGHFGILANGCFNMTVTNVQLLCSSGNYHRDAFNLISSSDVIVSNCVIQGSDDAMVLKSDYALGMKINSHDIVVTDCQILSTQNNATQFGSETVGDFTNVTWTHLQLTQAGKAGIGITSQDGSVIDGVTYEDITMSNCACPILLKLDLRSGQPGSPNPTVGRIRNISISDVTAVHSVSIDTGISPRTNTATIDGFSSTTNIPISNITFSNVNISTIGGYLATAITNYPVQDDNWTPDSMGVRPSFGWYLRYAQNISFTNCQVHFDQNDDRPAVIGDTVTNIYFNGLTADVGNGNTNFDMGFTNAVNFQITNAVASTKAPSPGAALRIFPSTNAVISQPPPIAVTNFFFEAESIPFITNGAIAAVQSDANSSGGKWEALEAASTNGNPYIQYTLANVPAGTYQLNLKYKGNTERGIITHQVDGISLNNSIDEYSPTQSYPELSLGNFTFTNSGNHTIRQTVIGKNPANTSQPWASADRFALLLIQPPQPAFNGTLAFSNGMLQLGGSGFPTLPYRVQVNTNLGSTNWITIATNYADSNGNLNFTDTNAASQPSQFYRIVTP